LIREGLQFIPRQKQKSYELSRKKANPVEHQYQLETQAIRVTTTLANVEIMAVMMQCDLAIETEISMRIE
jgi:hypothetical protein